jgi:hypothetical protein
MPTPTPAPSFQGEHRVSVKVNKRKKIVEFQLNFSGSVNSATGQYLVTQPGLKKKSPPKAVAVLSATPGSGGTTVTLTLGKYTTTKPLMLTVTGLMGSNGASVGKVVTNL